MAEGMSTEKLVGIIILFLVLIIALIAFVPNFRETVIGWIKGTPDYQYKYDTEIDMTKLTPEELGALGCEVPVAAIGSKAIGFWFNALGGSRDDRAFYYYDGNQWSNTNMHVYYPDDKTIQIKAGSTKVGTIVGTKMKIDTDLFGADFESIKDYATREMLIRLDNSEMMRGQMIFCKSKEMIRAESCAITKGSLSWGKDKDGNNIIFAQLQVKPSCLGKKLNILIFKAGQSDNIGEYTPNFKPDEDNLYLNSDKIDVTGSIKSQGTGQYYFKLYADNNPTDGQSDYFNMAGCILQSALLTNNEELAKKPNTAHYYLSILGNIECYENQKISVYAFPYKPNGGLWPTPVSTIAIYTIDKNQKSEGWLDSIIPLKTGESYRFCFLVNGNYQKAVSLEREGVRESWLGAIKYYTDSISEANVKSCPKLS